MTISKNKRQEIYSRDKCVCQYCGVFISEAESTIDHIIPRSQGGSNALDNLMLCCKSCNSSKGTRSIEHLRHHRRLQLSKYRGIINVNTHMTLVGLGVKFESLPEYVFYFERRK